MWEASRRTWVGQHRRHRCGEATQGWGGEATGEREGNRGWMEAIRRVEVGSRSNVERVGEKHMVKKATGPDVRVSITWTG